MMILLPLLFHSPESSLWRTLLSRRESDLSRHFVKVIFVFCVILPACSFLGFWDLYLSAALYSGNTPVAVARLSQSVRDRLPLHTQSHVFVTQSGELMLPFYEWSMAELNVPPYPEIRVYRKLARRLSIYAEDAREVTLIIKEKPAILTGQSKVLVLKTNLAQ